MKRFVLIAAGAATLALGGCTVPFTAKVARFQTLPPPAGQSFVVRPADPEDRGGIEFSMYARDVSARLAAQGYRPVAPGSRSDLVVTLDYHVDGGRERVYSTPDAFGYGGFGYGGFGGYGPYGFYGRRSWAYGFYDPFLFGGGFGGNDVSSYTVYTSELDLRIANAGDGRHVFEGTARATSRSDDLPYLVPRLIDAMFTGFPGNSGEIVRITVAPEKNRRPIPTYQAPPPPPSAVPAAPTT